MSIVDGQHVRFGVRPQVKRDGVLDGFSHYGVIQSGVARWWVIFNLEQST